MQLHNRIDKKVLRERLQQSAEERTTISFYQYANIENPQQFRDDLYKSLSEIGVFGRIYVANEGINAQISVLTSNLEKLKSHLDTISFLKDIRLNIAVDDDGKSFYKLIIKVREKIVADGLNDATFDVTDKGTHVRANEFNQLADDPNTVIVDMRNHYESEVGHFQNAIVPQVETFREELPFVEELLNDQKDKNLLLYCTGGIRCEKASAYFRHKGFKNVYQLEGGIINYTRQVQKEELPNKFIGKNFVFDERLGERITEDVISNCHQCGKPSDRHLNCANDACHLLFIQCEECAEKLENCCSHKCHDFSKLPKEDRERLRVTEQFNGTVFSKNTASKNMLRNDMQVDFEEI